jgi:hypothetical protein
LNGVGFAKVNLTILSLGLVFATATQAESVLERVLGQIDGATNLAQVNGTFANIAESVLTTRVETVSTETNLASAAPTVRIFEITGPGPSGGGTYWVSAGQLGTTIPAAVTGFYDDVVVAADGTVSMVNATDMFTGDSYNVRDVTLTALATITDTAGIAPTLSGGEIVFSDGTNSYLANSAVGLAAGWVKVPQLANVSVSSVIDGSVTNLISGLTIATASAVTSASSASEFAMLIIDIGDISTTTLGAVNTGEIAVGVNSAVDEAMSSSTRAIQTSIGIVGGSSDTGAMMLNVAHNTSAIQGNVTNTLVAMNGSVGNVNTTVLGAVNTGTIANGVNVVILGITGTADFN